MSSPADKFRRGMIVPEPKGPGGFLARSFRKLVCQILTCLMNINVKAIIANDGVSPNTVDAKVTYSPSGVTAELDLTTIVAGSGSSSLVPYSGNGPPSNTTLPAGSYVTGPVPSLYVDLSAIALYVCTTAGDETTSVWQKISGSTVPCSGVGPPSGSTLSAGNYTAGPVPS